MKGGHDEFTLDWTNRSFASYSFHSLLWIQEVWNINFWFFSSPPPPPTPRFSFFMRVNYWKGISCAMKEAHEFLFSFSFFCIHTKRKGNGAWVNVRVRHKNFRCEEIGRRNLLLHYKENRNAQWIKLAYRFLRRSFFLFIESSHPPTSSFYPFEMLSWCKRIRCVKESGFLCGLTVDQRWTKPAKLGFKPPNPKLKFQAQLKRSSSPARGGGEGGGGAQAAVTFDYRHRLKMPKPNQRQSSSPQAQALTQAQPRLKAKPQSPSRPSTAQLSENKNWAQNRETWAQKLPKALKSSQKFKPAEWSQYEGRSNRQEYIYLRVEQN